MGGGYNGIDIIWGPATKQESPYPWRDQGAVERVLHNHITQAGLSLDQVRVKRCSEAELFQEELRKSHECAGPQPDHGQRDRASAGLVGPTAKVVVACGYAAASTLVQRQGLQVLDHHCYVFNRTTGSRATPVVVALHPETIFREPNRGHWLAWACRKAAALAAGREAVTPVSLKVQPTLQEALGFLAACEREPWLSIDIEKPKAGYDISCFSVAPSGQEAMSIPLMQQFKASYWTPDEEAQIWRALCRLLEGPNGKIFQNFIFDTMVFRANGIKTRGPLYCTMATANVLNPRLEKGLADLGRLYCYCEPWKSAQDWNLAGDMRAFWRYNAEDAVRTWDIARRQRAELAQRGLTDFHATYVAPLYPLVLDTCCRGMHLDAAAQAAARETLERTMSPLEATLRSIADPLLPPKIKKKKLRDKEHDTQDAQGQLVKAYREVHEEVPQDFNPGSPLQIKQVLAALGYKIPTARGRETTDRGALLKLYRKMPHEFITGLLQWTRLAKLQSSYADLDLDADGRVRYSYAVGGTKSGRFSSSKTPWGTGLNVQTLPRPSAEVPVNLRACFTPDDGRVFVQVDLGQAELRVVAYLAREEKLIELLDHGQDIHTYTADTVGKLIGQAVPRQLGKMLNHAANYGMGAQRFSDACLEDAGLTVSAADAGRLLDARRRAFPGITAWQDSVARDLRRTRRLVSPHGRTALFYGPLEDETIRDAYSFVPQATVADTTNLAWIKLGATQEYADGTFQVLQQGHDSLLFQVRTADVARFLELINIVYASLGVVVGGKMLVIPWDIAIGPNWGELKKYVA